MRRSCVLWLMWGQGATTGISVPPRRRRQFVMNYARSPDGSQTHSSSSNKSASIRPPPGVTRELSQRERYRAFEESANSALTQRGVPGEWLSSVPPRHGLCDGVDEHGYDAPRPSREERRSLLQSALECRAASVVEFTDGGEADIELGGLPESEFHGREGWTSIPRDSALYSSVHARAELDSRQRHNSWSMARRRQPRRQQREAEDDDMNASMLPRVNAKGDVFTDNRRRELEDEGSYTERFEGGLLEPNEESISHPRSTYGLRKLFINGLTGFQGIISKAEEAQLCDELLRLLQDPRAAYIAEETRYCVNLYEQELGIPGKDTLAFAISRAPTLHQILMRFFHLGLIPCPPNVCQVSEMIGNFSGYPVHKKPAAIGPYVGILNLVSTSVMYLQHVDCPWFPRLHMNPRSLFVVEHPCLSEYKMGYKQTHQPFHSFEYATRVSKDYRIEVLFATVEASHMRYLNDAVGMTEYAERKMLPQNETNGVSAPPASSLSSSSSSSIVSAQITQASSLNKRVTSGVPFQGSTDKWLAKLREQLHISEESNATAAEKGSMVDGAALREHLIATGGIGVKTRPLETKEVSGESTPQTPVRRRMEALKARYDFAKRLKEEAGPKASSESVRVIPGHSPRHFQRL